MPKGNEPERKPHTEEEEEKVSAGMEWIVGHGGNKFRCAVCHNLFPDIPGKTKFYFRGAYVCANCMRKLREREYEARKEREKTRFESVFAGGKGIAPTPTPQPQETTPASQITSTSQPTPERKEPRRCPKCGRIVGELQKKCKCGYNLETGELEKKSFKEIISGKLSGYKETIKTLPKTELLKGFEKLEERAGVVKSHVTTNIKLAILLPIAILSVFRCLIPSVEGISGTTVPYSQQAQAFFWKSWWVIMAAVFGVALPIGVVTGKSGMNLNSLNTLCIYSIAGSVGIWGTTNVVLPAVKTFMPEEYAFLMCLMKYRGNIQVCVAPNQTVQYKKVGSYETLKVEMGAVTPTQAIPPPNPVPDTWSDTDPYYFPITLSNKNAIGSAYDIIIPQDGVEVSASPYEDGRDSRKAKNILDVPNYPIKPGGYTIVTAMFNESFYPGKLVNCKQYTFFNINVTTQQIGGGSSKFGIIQSDVGMDNQNFMYFFDPDVKTEPGPLDIYVYTLPFVIAHNRARELVNYPHFGVYIKIKNKGGGTAFLDNMTLIQTSDISPKPISISDCLLIGNSSLYMSYGYDTDEYCPTGKNGSCILIKPVGKPPIKKDEDLTFRCNGRITDPTKPFYGKTTELISVVAHYTYLQISKEQMACVKAKDMILNYCMGNGKSKEACENITICHWCDECDNNNHVSLYPNQCVDVETDCGYHCEKNKCEGECGSHADCESMYCDLSNCKCSVEYPGGYI